MTSNSTRVRAAAIADAPALGQIHVAAWRAAYRGIMPANHLAALAAEDRAALWTTVISRSNPAEIVLVSESGGSLTGFCAAGSAWRPEEAGLGEVQSLNVNPRAWGTGAGDALLARAEDWLRGRQFQDAILRVVRDNLRARRFYERHGWTDDGRSDIATVLGVAVPEVRYRRHLAP
jgi:GNAT superfamily N-acetyltransferase